MKSFITRGIVMNVFKQILKLMKPEPKKVPGRPSEVDQPDMIHNRISRLAADNPGITEYIFNIEEEAAELLYAMCATLDLMAKNGPEVINIKNAREYVKLRKNCKSEARKLKGIISRQQALKYIGNNNLKMCGLNMVGLYESL